MCVSLFFTRSFLVKQKKKKTTDNSVNRILGRKLLNGLVLVKMKRNNKIHRKGLYVVLFFLIIPKGCFDRGDRHHGRCL
jgi:hypothetical protein